ncbi:MAG: hypothetical protein V7785_12985 [Bermanella sp.]
MITLRMSMLIILMASAASSVQGEPRIDYDLDDNGLIEINDLQDLNEIRNNLNDANILKGESLYGVGDGCPLDGCNGYELTNDLNFDTNGNNVFDEGDAYWNEGLGWVPIGFAAYKITIEFNGNGHTLQNLVIRRPGEGFVGLFSRLELAYLHDFKLTADIVADSNSGGIAGFSWKTTFENLNVDIAITVDKNGFDCAVNICPPDFIGGIVGTSNDSSFENIVIKAQVTGLGVDYVPGVLGGLAGGLSQGTVNEVVIKGSVNGSTQIGGLAGYVTGANIESVVAITELSGSSSVGGLIGRAAGTTFNNILVSGTVNTGIGLSKDAKGGGLIGLADSGVNATGVISLVALPSDTQNVHYIGALMGSVSDTTVSDVYWANDLALRDYLYGSDHELGEAQSFNLTDIQCATDAAGCNGLAFNGFSEKLNSLEQALWDFGDNEEAPVMVLASGRFGDKDGNGQVDEWIVNDWPVEEGNGAQARSNDSSSGIGGLFYMVVLLLPILFRRR